MTSSLTEPADASLVWYVAYGSNMHADRLHFYLVGGTHPSGTRTYPGCRDGRPPRRTVATMIAGGIYFALESIAWTGGLALYDRDLPGRAAVRAYLLTAGQLADIAAQEMYREPGNDLELLDEVVTRGRLQLGDGRYETLLCTGHQDGYPMITFTAHWHCADVPVNPPAGPYLARIATGLQEAHGWGADDICSYLGSRPGVQSHWSPTDLQALVKATL